LTGLFVFLFFGDRFYGYVLSLEPLNLIAFTPIGVLAIILKEKGFF